MLRISLMIGFHKSLGCIGLFKICWGLAEDSFLLKLQETLWHSFDSITCVFFFLSLFLICYCLLDYVTNFINKRVPLK